ncbi:hypothetical protein [Nocardia blacklockiae]|uniref:hypothetical protein n=1 Tax=Nocardia blacklockiae TaxID=480036 RepID=UPI0018958751|nr:hypothetical protein [Nocardia blacklockiae]MBF6175506.1 hypothetical protein [Nocardia blacklockiae]
MKFRSSTAVGALAIGALTVGLGTAHAEPAAPAEHTDKTIGYSVAQEDKTVVARLGNGGTFELVAPPAATATEIAAEATEPAPTQVNVKDDKGNTVLSFPLEYTITGQRIPVASELKEDGKVLAVTPERPAGLPTDQPLNVKPVAKPIASPVENQRALTDFSTYFGLSTAIGGFVGTAIGAVVGCALGLIGVVVGCLVGLPTGAAIGGILGTIVVGGPTLVAAGTDLVSTLNAPPGTTKWTDDAIQKQQQVQQPAPVN